MHLNLGKEKRGEMTHRDVALLEREGELRKMVCKLRTSLTAGSLGGKAASKYCSLTTLSCMAL